MKYLRRYLSLLFALVMCVGVFSVTAHAEEITNLDLTLNIKLYNSAYEAVSINETVTRGNNERFLYEFEANTVGINHGTRASFTATVGTDDGSIIAKKNDTFNFRIDNIHMSFYMDGYGWFNWSNGNATDRQLALIHTDGSWTYLYEGIDWNYTSGNETHNISVNVTTPKDVRKIQYVESVKLLDLAGLTMNTHYNNITVFGDSINPLKVTIDKQSEEAGLLQGIGNKLSSGFSALGDKLTNVFNSIVELPQKLWNLISDGLKGLFVPSEESMTAYKDKWDELLASRFGAVYQVVNIMTDSWDGIMQADQTDTITFPQATLNFGGTGFTFGGYDVKIVPDGFDVLVTAIKSIVAIVCTVAFVNGLRKRYDEIMGVEQ